jgi:hypothetical protein
MGTGACWDFDAENVALPSPHARNVAKQSNHIRFPINVGTIVDSGRERVGEGGKNLITKGDCAGDRTRLRHRPCGQSDLQSAGYSAVLAGRRVAQLEQTAALAWPTGGTMSAAKETFGRLEVLFNKAGINVPALP